MNARLHEALASLPAVQREAILLREYGEHSVEEIARITGVNAETAKAGCAMRWAGCAAC